MTTHALVRLKYLHWSFSQLSYVCQLEELMMKDIGVSVRPQIWNENNGGKVVGFICGPKAATGV